MKILAQQNTEELGNDCIISTNWALCSLFNSEVLIKCVKCSGWGGGDLEFEIHTPSKIKDPDILNIFNKLKEKSNEE